MPVFLIIVPLFLVTEKTVETEAICFSIELSHYKAY